MDENIGMIIHWGIYSCPAYDNVALARKRNIQNGSEWYYGRLTNENKFRQISGSTDTQEWHRKNYQNKNYYDFDITENPNISKWIDAAKNINASYIILTAKHHDGFCLWPSKHAEHHTKRDIIKDFCNEAKNAGLKYGIYYSWCEFNKRITKDFIKNTIVPQIRELATNAPMIWWFDGHWEIKSQFAKDSITSICKVITNDGAIINDRIPDLDLATYRVYEDRHIPTKKPSKTWEHINTIGLSWGYNKQQKESDYKTGKQLYQLYQQVKKLGGNFLINIGPNDQGEIDENELKSLNEFSTIQNENK